ncbi:hypothetical protein ACQJBY_023685 [Aegilops geniculata]
MNMANANTPSGEQFWKRAAADFGDGGRRQISAVYLRVEAAACGAGVTPLTGGSVEVSSDAGGSAADGGLVGRRPSGGCQQENKRLALLCGLIINWNRECRIRCLLSIRSRRNRSPPPYLSAISRPNLQIPPISASKGTKSQLLAIKRRNA